MQLFKIKSINDDHKTINNMNKKLYDYLKLNQLVVLKPIFFC